MTIKNLRTYVSKLWDWGFLDDCFGHTGIRVSDVDGIVERNGQFLLLEAKSPGKAVPRGQAIMFDAMVETGVFTVIVLWGDDSTPERMARWPHPSIPCSTEDVKGFVRQWFRDASLARGDPDAQQHSDS